jgi:hypothetical protein
MTRIRLALLLFLATACAATPQSSVRVAHLATGEGFEELRAAFCEANPGYDVSYVRTPIKSVVGDRTQVLFVQRGTGSVSVQGMRTELARGDIVVLRPGQAVIWGGWSLSLLAFHVPSLPPDSVPTVVRPDWDEAITDTPGGCAEETGAYRRILLTWLDSVGPYVYRAINAHRVRITDSFTHYHPTDGGFDEFYLVQMAQPESRLLTSEHVDWIESGAALSAKRAAKLFETHSLRVGDLVYMPRGTAHRGLGGALVQVITVPGFRPGAEVGLDHHLREIDAAHPALSIPYHEAAAAAPVIK